MAQSLPKNSAEFSDPNYWKKFFSIHRSPFEWYGDYSSLGLVFDKYFKPTDDILQIGCGNSQLASQLHDVGYKNIMSIDTNSAVINEQIARNRERASLTFRVGSATEVEFESESYNVVVDKGTLDALLPPNDEEAVKVATKMFDEVCRVLRSSGRYLVVTLAQQHIIQLWTDYFLQTKQYILRIHKIENTATGFPMPVFVLVATKLKMPMPSSMGIEMMRSVNEKGLRLDSLADVHDSIEGEQMLSRFVHLCSKTLTHEVSIVLSSADGSGDRYRIFIVDDAEVTRPRSFSVFIVPIGRDGDWLFATEKGRRSLRMQCKKDRLAIVTLVRDVNYGSLQHIKDELASFVLRLNPVKGEKERVEFLSMGDHDVKRSVAGGRSEINGKWSVEDVVIREREYRRLVFLSSQNLVQSEAAVRVGKKGKKVVSLDELACEHHEVMLLAFALLPDSPLLKPDKTPVNVAVLGLGGGLLAAFLIRHLAAARVTGVELDASVVEIATKYFSFPYSDGRMRVRVMDALDWMQETAAVGAEKQDVLLVDLASSMTEEGLSCPPPPFLTEHALQNMHDCLSENGVLALNLVTRDEDVSKAAKEKVAAHFATLCVVSSEEDVNEVLIATKSSITFDSRRFVKQLNREKPWIAGVAAKIDKLMVM